MIPDRILNPKKYYSTEKLSNLPVVEINGTKFRKLTRDERRTITSCQCNHDCSCNGSVVGKIVDYFRKVEFDNTDKAFYSDPNYTPSGFIF